MLNLLKKIFALASLEAEDEQVYVDYDAKTVETYREQFPDIQMDEVRVPNMPDQRYFKIRKWLKNDGDRIRKGERLCLIETDSFSMDLESFLDGYLYFRQKPDKRLGEGQVICLLLSRLPE